jgi:hypothetical protein
LTFSVDQDVSLFQQRKINFFTESAAGKTMFKLTEAERMEPLSIAHGRAWRMKNSILNHRNKFYQQIAKTAEYFAKTIGCVSSQLNQNLTGFQMALFCHKPICARHPDI